MKDIREVRDSIKEAAAYLFSRLGYEKTTLADISQRSHRAKTLVYYHFGGKLSLLKETLQDEFAELERRLDFAMGQGPMSLPGSLTAYLRDRMDILSESKVYSKYAVESMLSVGGEVNGAVQEIRGSMDSKEKDYFMEIAQLCLDFGVFSPAVDPESFSQMIILLLKGLEIQFYSSDPEGRAAAKATYGEVMEKLINGCKSERSRI